jgi:hypothetical protein
MRAGKIRVTTSAGEQFSYNKDVMAGNLTTCVDPAAGDENRPICGREVVSYRKIINKPRHPEFIHSSHHVVYTQDSCYHFCARKFVAPDNLRLGWRRQDEPRPVHVNRHGFAKPQRNDRY